MRRLLLFVTFFSTLLTATFAQDDQKFHVGIHGGMNLAAITQNSSDYRVGFNAGVIANYQFSKKYFVSSGLAVTQKGCKYDDPTVEAKANPLYLQLPIYIGACGYTVKRNVRVSLEVGPYLAYGIGGKLKTTSLVANSEHFGVERDIDFFDVAERFETGVGFRLGFQYERIQFLLGYEYGITTLSKEGNGNNSSFNAGFAFYL